MVPGGALILVVQMHTGAGFTQNKWQVLSTIGQWLTSQVPLFIIGGDIQVEPEQLEDSGWSRAVGAFVVAPQLATVTPLHRVIDFFVGSRDLAGACEAAAHISQHIAPHRPVRIVVSTRLIQPMKRVMSRPNNWPADRPSGCRKRDPVRWRVQAAAGAQAEWTSFIDAVEELVDAFLIALDEAGAFCARSQGQKLVWKACKCPWCDKFPRGSYEMQSWRRTSRICKHILTARQLLDSDSTNCCSGRSTLTALAPWAWSTSCRCSLDRHTSWLLFL